MNNKTPFDFFAEYQPKMTSKKWVELYTKLIQEEQDEFLEALKNKDIIEMYDAVADLIWVKAWLEYFLYLWETTNWKKVCTSNWELFINERHFINMFNRECVLECINEVSRSNFTKSKELRTDWEKIGKIIKWPNYSAPKLEPILKKYWMIK